MGTFLGGSALLHNLDISRTRIPLSVNLRYFDPISSPKVFFLRMK